MIWKSKTSAVCNRPVAARKVVSLRTPRAVVCGDTMTKCAVVMRIGESVSFCVLRCLIEVLLFQEVGIGRSLLIHYPLTEKLVHRREVAVCKVVKSCPTAYQDLTSCACYVFVQLALYEFL